jgi:Flp pilus assembly protein TadD
VLNLYISLKAEPAKIEAVSNRALQRVTHRLEMCPDDARAVYLSVSPLMALGRTQEAEERTEHGLAIDPDGADVQYNAACYFALAGNSERALDCLERAVDCGFNTREWIEQDMDMEPLRDIDRYKKIMKRLK